MKDLIVPILVLLGVIGIFWLFGSKYPITPFIQRDIKVEDNKNNMNEIKTVDGLKIVVLKEGNGEEALSGKMVSVHYTGKFEDGKVFDSSVSRGEPFEFALGAGQVIRGWDLGVAGMKIGEKRELTISSDLAYGDRGIVAPNGVVVIPEKATLIFEVELLGVK